MGGKFSKSNVNILIESMQLYATFLRADIKNILNNIELTRHLIIILSCTIDDLSDTITYIYLNLLK